MRVLSLSLDTQVLNAESVAASRMRAYGEALEGYSVVVPAQETVRVSLGGSVQVYGVSGVTKLGTLVRMFFCSRRLLKEEGYDVVTSQDPYFLGLLGVLLARLYGCGLEIQAHGVEKDTVLRRTLARLVYRQSDVVRTVSQRLQKTLQERYSVPSEKIVVIPVFVDVSSLGLSTASTPQEVQEKVSRFKSEYKNTWNILSVSRLVPVKNISLQLQALKELRERGVNAHLHIAGEGSERSVLVALAQTLRLTEFITFHRRQTGFDLGALYVACDCLLLTSISEGYGMVLIEALHAGLPIVTTDVGCVGEVIVNEQNALVVAEGDLHALTEALVRVNQDKATLTRLRSGARETLQTLPTFPETIMLYTQTWSRARDCRKKVDE